MSRVLIFGALPESLLTFRRALIASLLDQGHEVVAAAGGAAIGVANSLKEKGVPYYPIRMQRTGMNPFSDILTLWDSYRLMRKVSPELVLCYTAKPVIYGLLAARLARVPRLAAMIEGLGFAFTGRSLKHWMLAKLLHILYGVSLSRCNTVFFLNPDDQAFFRDHRLLGARCKQARINGIGVDLEHFAVRPLPASPVFLLVARLLKDKGVVEYAEAARRVKVVHPEARFLLVGWLDENPSCIPYELLESWVREGLIDYRGHLSDVRPVYEECAVYVLPSYREGLPVTIMEAMAMGRVIVATDVPGCRETVVNGVNGFLVPAKDVEALTECLLRFFEVPGLASRMGAESRRIAEERYDVKRINSQILTVLGLK